MASRHVAGAGVSVAGRRAIEVVSVFEPVELRPLVSKKKVSMRPLPSKYETSPKPKGSRGQR